MSDFAEVTTIISKFGRDEIRFLTLFKILKSQITLELKKENQTFPDEKLNKVCVDVTNRLLLLDKPHSSEVEIKQIIDEIKSKYCKNKATKPERNLEKRKK